MLCKSEILVSGPSLSNILINKNVYRKPVLRTIPDSWDLKMTLGFLEVSKLNAVY